MTVLEPLPGTYGKADWVDYSNYWREADAEWLQDRIVLRAPNAAARDALGQSAGALVYNEALDQIELCSKLSAGATKVYKTLTPLPTTLTTTEVAGPPQKTTISHTGAGGLGLTFTAGEVGVTSNLNVQGVLTVDANGVGIKAVGAKTAKLSTSATDLVSDSPVSAPGITITAPGTISAAGRAATVGALSASSATVSGVLTGGNGSIIGGVSLTGNKATASAGFDSQQGSFYGDGTSAIVRHVNRTGPYVQADANNITIAGGGCYMHSLLRIQGAAARIYHEGTGKNFAPSFYQASGTPDVNAYPEGTIWIS